MSTDESAFDVAPREIAERLCGGEPPDLIDVREPYEWEIAHIPGARLVPLATLAEVVPTLDPGREYVVLCHHGARSALAVHAMRAAGLRGARNLAGGIDRWSLEVDPSVGRY